MHQGKQGVNCQCGPVREKLLEIAKTMKMPSFGGPWFCTVLHPGTVGVNMTRIQANECNNRNFTKAECQLREDVFTFASLLRKNIEEFKYCYVSSVAVQAGARETRHIRGTHIISAEEYLESFRYEDSVSRCAHPIDVHSSKGEKQSLRFLKKAAYVPFRAMIMEDFPNLIVAGRPVSADETAFASLRVQASCMGMGQAAGFAAAESVAQGRSVQNIDIPLLVDDLKKAGACLDD
jgi:hypothetical protein